MKLLLEKPKLSRFGRPSAIWSACLPFVENSRAVLIHRPRMVSTYNLHRAMHIAVHYWCNNASTGSKNFTFLEVAPDGRLVCERCENAAVQAGLPSTDALCGSHRHKGKVVAVQTCHKKEPRP
jgi:hypothetical protein